jgi:DNA-binding MltR family transcriptional regulator
MTTEPPKPHDPIEIPNVQTEPPKTLGEGLDKKLTPAELAAFEDETSDRARAIVLAAILEDHLTAVLKFLMRRDEAVAKELFKSTGPLGPFGTKIRMGYMLRVLHQTTYKDFLIVSRIRNRFAHDLILTTFEDQQITAWIKNMHVYSILVQMAEHLTALARDEPEPEPREPQRPMRVSRKGMAFIARMNLVTMNDAYKECVRLLIHHLVDFENRIKSTEAGLNEKKPDQPSEPSPEKP